MVVYAIISSNYRCIILYLCYVCSIVLDKIWCNRLTAFQDVVMYQSVVILTLFFIVTFTAQRLCPLFSTIYEMIPHSSVCTVYIVEHECTCCLPVYIFCSIHLALATRYRCHLLLYCISQRCGVIVNNNFTLAFILRTFWSVLTIKFIALHDLKH